MANDGEGLESWEARRRRNLEKHVNGNGMGTPLAVAAQMWMTPNVPAGIRRPAAGTVGPTGRHVGGGKQQVSLEQQGTELWAMPTAHERTHTPREVDHGEQLANQVSLWATPSARDGRSGEASAETLARNARPLNEQAANLWSTPRSTDGEKGGPNMSFGAGGTPLPTPASAAAWMPSPSGPPAPPTPQAGPLSSPVTRCSPPRCVNATCGHVPCEVAALLRMGERGRKSAAAFRRRLNPRFVEWLQGLPGGWTACAPSETLWYQSRQRSLLGSLLRAWGLPCEEDA